MIIGAGEPVAAHLSVTLLPSRTIISVLVGKSRMSGGTENVVDVKRKIRNVKEFRHCINQQSI